MQGRRRLTPTAGVVPCLLQFRAAPRESAPAVGRADTHQRGGFGAIVAALYPGDGGGADQPCLVAARGVTLSGAAVAPAAGGLRNGVS